MQELETLLKSLIQRGRKPGNEKADFCEYKFGKFRFLQKSGQIVCMRSLRELVSLESGLWQFVCDNELYKLTYYRYEVYFRSKRDGSTLKCSNPRYRLLESALTPEGKLGQFLVENIKTE